MRQRVRAAAAVIERNGKILIGRRRTNDPLKGTWEFPGGKVKPGESPETCIIRELHEELGMDINVNGLLHTLSYDYEHVCVTLFFYRAEVLSEGYTCREYDELRWVPAAELDRYEFPAANREVISLISVR
jgi:mutator protein MutT